MVVTSFVSTTKETALMGVLAAVVTAMVIKATVVTAMVVTSCAASAMIL